MIYLIKQEDNNKVIFLNLCEKKLIEEKYTSYICKKLKNKNIIFNDLGFSASIGFNQDLILCFHIEDMRPKLFLSLFKLQSYKYKELYNIIKNN